jgi:hypothetical protein
MTSPTSYVDDDYWQPGYSEGESGTAPFSPLDTVASQYRNSPTLLQLIASFNQYVNPSLNFQQFYDWVWNIQTAKGFGLDILGRIVGTSRQIVVPAIYPVTVAPGVRNLTDDQFRPVVLAKALSNIVGTSSEGINSVLRALTPDRGNAFVDDVGDMRIRYKFLFALRPVEFAIIAQSGAVTHPAGVQTSVFNVQPYFGFSESESWSTFGENVFAAY